MLPALLIGFTAGARAMTPFTIVSDAAAQGTLPPGSGEPAWLGHPLTALGAKLLAGGELVGDKQPDAPDRTVAAGMTARVLTGALAGAALTARHQRLGGMVAGGLAAAGSAYLTLALRKRAMARFGQASTGIVEDVLVLTLARRALSVACRRAGA